MGIRKYKPTSPGRRGMTSYDHGPITTDEPYRPLVSRVHSPQGRNNNGRITSRFRGGGHKRLYRQIDFKREKFGVEGRVATIEYDPGRTCFIALVHYADGEKRYVLAPEGLGVGDSIVSDARADIRPGNCLPLAAIPATSRAGSAVRALDTSRRITAESSTTRMRALVIDFSPITKLPAAPVCSPNLLS